MVSFRQWNLPYCTLFLPSRRSCCKSDTRFTAPKKSLSPWSGWLHAESPMFEGVNGGDLDLLHGVCFGLGRTGRALELVTAYGFADFFTVLKKSSKGAWFWVEPIGGLVPLANLTSQIWDSIWVLTMIFFMIRMITVINYPYHWYVADGVSISCSYSLSNIQLILEVYICSNHNATGHNAIMPRVWIKAQENARQKKNSSYFLFVPMDGVGCFPDCFPFLP